MKRTLGKLNLTQAVVIAIVTQGYGDSYPVIPQSKKDMERKSKTRLEENPKELG